MITVKAVKIDGEIFNVNVTYDNYLIIRMLLEKERVKIINKMKIYKTAGFINSISRPRNKALQSELNDLIKKKLVLKNSINQINRIFK